METGSKAGVSLNKEADMNYDSILCHGKVCRGNAPPGIEYIFIKPRNIPINEKTLNKSLNLSPMDETQVVSSGDTVRVLDAFNKKI